MIPGCRCSVEAQVITGVRNDVLGHGESDGIDVLPLSSALYSQSGL